MNKRFLIPKNIRLTSAPVAADDTTAVNFLERNSKSKSSISVKLKKMDVNKHDSVRALKEKKSTQEKYLPAAGYASKYPTTKNGRVVAVKASSFVTWFLHKKNMDVNMTTTL